MSPLGRVALSTLFLLVFAAVFPAQDLDDVTISGKITDPNGQIVAGATITATQIETGQTRTATSDDKGMFQIVKLKPGTYKVKVENGGFAPQERTDLTTISGQVVHLEFKLAVGSVNAQQTVNVTDEDAPAVDTTRTVVGGTITQREVEEIPNTSRNALDLVLTLGGTSEEQLSTNGLADDRGANPRTAPLEQGNFSISGGTAYSNNITIDGLDNNDDLTSRDRFQPSLEAIAEVQVVANQFSAEYGRASGGRVNLRTRSGGNKFRGRAFGFFRDESLNSNSWYNNSRGISRPPLQEINPGFTFGGPVILPFYNGHKRTFFFVAYEHDNFADTTLIDAFLPVGSNPHYTLPSPTGTTQFCDTTGSPAPPCPLAGGSPGSAPLSEYTKQFSTPNVSDVVTARIDHRLFNNNDLTIGFQFGRKNNKRTTGSTVTKIENAFQSKLINTEAYNVTDNQVFGSHAVNQFRAQWSRYQPSYEAPNPFDPVVIVGYRDPISNSVKSLTAGNSTLSTNQNFADTRTETRWQFQDTLTYVVGRHTFKGGLDIQNVVSKVEGLGDATGTFNFGNALAYTQNIINRYRQNFGTGQDVKNKYIGVFFNDQMQLWSRVTLSAGLRYERETAVSDDNNLGPRLAVAWSPFKSNKTVLRFGTGIFYNRVLLRTVGDSIQNTSINLVSFDSSTIGAAATDSRRTFILNAIAAAFPATYPTVADLKALVTSVCPTVPSPLGPCNANTGFSVGNVSSAGNPLRSVEAGLKIPESYQFNIGFERELVKGWVFEANYTWNKTAFLWRDENSNAPRLPAGFADWTDYLRNHTLTITNLNGTTRTYSFVLGATNDPSGISGLCSFTVTSPCIVNLNSTSTTATAPAATVAGSNGNVTGGPVGIALAAISQFRPDQTVSETSLIGSRGRAFYQGLILELRSRYRKLGAGFGSSFRMAYTLSSTMDDGLNNTANAEVDGDFAREWARSLQDRRHRFALSGTLDTPWWFGKLKFSPLFRYGSSAPFNLGAGGSDRNLDDLGTDRLNFSGDIKDIKYREPGSPPPDALLAQFSLQPIGSKSGSLPRNAGTGPSFFTFDLNVGREWKLNDRMKLRPVLEFDNIFNAAVFSYGSEFVDFQALSSTITPTQQLARDNFLVPTRTYRQRQIRVGLRFDF